MMCGLLKPTSGTRRRSTASTSAAIPSRQEADRLHVAEVLAVRALTVDQNIRFFGALYGLTTSDIAGGEQFVARDGRSCRTRNTKARISPGAGDSGWRWAAPFSTNRPSCFSTSRRAVSIRSRAASSGGSSKTCRASGVTILVTTHYLDEAEHCHRHRDHERRQAGGHGNVGELKQMFADRPIVEIRSARPVDVMRALDEMPEVEKTTMFGTAVHAVLRTPARSIWTRCTRA